MVCWFPRGSLGPWEQEMGEKHLAVGWEASSGIDGDEAGPDRIMGGGKTCEYAMARPGSGLVQDVEPHVMYSCIVFRMYLYACVSRQAVLRRLARTNRSHRETWGMVVPDEKKERQAVPFVT